MAFYYVYSGAGGAGTGADWTNAYTSLAAALAVAAAGDTIWVAHDHAANSLGSTQSYTSAGTVSNFVKIFCVNRAVASGFTNGDLRTTATETTTTSNLMTFAGAAYCYGVTFTCGNSTNSNTITFNSGSSVIQVLWVFDGSSALRIGGTGASGRIYLGSGSVAGSQGRVILKNSSMQFGASQQGICLRGINLEWLGGSVTGTAPSQLFTTVDVISSFTKLRNVDLSAFGSGKTLCAAFSCGQQIQFDRCKLGASVVVAASQTDPGARIDVINSDSGSTNYRSERYTMQGVETTETTIVMSGGASDGTTPFSRKIVTTTNASIFTPYESFVLAQDWVDTAGSAVSQTFELVNDGVTLTDQDAWIDYEYLGDNGTPLGTVASSFSGMLASGANLSSSSVTWTTTGLTSPVKQKITITFTPQKKGVYRAVLRVAKPSATIYVNPPATKAA